MQKLKIRLLKSYSLLLSLLLSLLGCSTGDSPCEYGMPQADFVLKGTVRSKTTAQPIAGIQVTVTNSHQFPDSAISAGNGNYEVTIEDFPYDQSFSVKFRDQDGTANGSYLPKDTIAEFKDPVFTGGDHNWYEGKTEKEFNVKLTPQE